MDRRVHVLWSWLFSKISSSSIWKQPGKTQPNYFMLIHRLAHNICIVSQWTAICKLVFVGVFVRVFYPVPDAFIWPLDMRSGLSKSYFKMSIYLSKLGVSKICLQEQLSHFNRTLLYHSGRRIIATRPLHSTPTFYLNSTSL